MNRRGRAIARPKVFKVRPAITFRGIASYPDSLRIDAVFFELPRQIVGRQPLPVGPISPRAAFNLAQVLGERLRWNLSRRAPMEDSANVGEQGGAIGGILDTGGLEYRLQGH